MEIPKLNDALVEVDGRVALLKLCRDDLRNALTGTTLADDIVRTVTWADGETGISVLVITGQGRAFSSGGNVKEMRDRQGTFAGSPGEIQQAYRNGIQRIPLALYRAGLPIIAAVNGPAIGAGFDLACMCDLRIASTNSQVGETFINLGIIPGDGGAWFLQRLIGYQRAAEMTLTGKIVSADEALRMGLFLEVVEPEALLPTTMELAHRLAAKPPLALRQTCRLLKLAQRTELPDFLELCASAQAVAHHTSDHLESVNAFLDKRKGVFTGA